MSLRVNNMVGFGGRRPTASGYAEAAVRFNGTNTYLTGTASAGVNYADGDWFCFFSAVFNDVSTGTENRILYNPSNRWELNLDTAGRIAVKTIDTSAVTIFNVTATNVVIGAGRVNVLAGFESGVCERVFVWDATNGLETVLNDTSTPATATADLTASTWYFGANNAPSSFLDADVYAMMLWTGASSVPDFSSSAIRNKFFNSSDGSLTDPAQLVTDYGTPSVYFNGVSGATEWNDGTYNLGSGAAYAKNGIGVTDVSVFSPSQLFFADNAEGLWISCTSDNCYTDAGTTLVSSSGDAVYQVNDLSGHDNHMVQATSADRPAWAVPGVDFVSTEHMGAPCSLTSTVLTTFAVAEYTAVDNYGRICTTTAFDTATAGDTGTATPQPMLRNAGSTEIAGYNNGFKSEVTTAINTVYLFESVFDGTNHTMYLNGRATSGTPVSSTNTFTTAFLRLGYNNSTPVRMKLYELIAIEKVLSTAETDNVEAYLNNKWSVYGSWTPNDLATVPSYWFDFSDSSRITLSGSNIVSMTTQDDAYTIGTVNANDPEVLSANQNGLDVGYFDSTNDEGLVSGGTTTYFASGALTLAAVYKAPTISTTGNYIMANAGGGGSDSRRYLLTGGIDFGDTSLSLTGISANTWVIVVGWIDSQGTPTTQYATVNGELTPQSGSVGSATPATQLGICQYGNGASGPTTATIGECMIIPASFSSAERQKIEGYLAHKWGLAANLPSGHPYKSWAP